jgi:hypothetical protein
MKKVKTEKINIASDEKISRKEAFKKAGITALAATSLLFLDAKNASAGSLTPARPGRPGRPK